MLVVRDYISITVKIKKKERKAMPHRNLAMPLAVPHGPCFMVSVCFWGSYTGLVNSNELAY